MKQLIAITWGVLTLSACASTAVAPTEPAKPTLEMATSEVTEIKDLAEVPKSISTAKGKVLVVFDVDDTLLTSAQFFGSDKWYEWQKSLAESDAGRVPCKFDVIGLNYEAGTQIVTQPEGPAIVGGVTQDMIFLTARNPLYRSGTVRELVKAGYPLPSPLVAEGIIYRWAKEPNASPVTVSYDEGVFMVSGQDKGVLLLDLLKKLHRSYDSILLVDDGKKNIQNMEAAMKGASISYIGLWYTRVRKDVSPQEAVDGTAAWQQMKTFLTGVFPGRASRLAANECFFK